jgi:hypothetical protein
MNVFKMLIMVDKNLKLLIKDYFCRKINKYEHYGFYKKDRRRV